MDESAYQRWKRRYGDLIAAVGAHRTALFTRYPATFAERFIADKARRDAIARKMGGEHALFLPLDERFR